MKTEFVRNLNSNYKRILLDRKPDEQRYQYCILNRGGIKGLLPCSLRYIDDNGYLYYDITSRQNMKQLFENKTISRDYVLDFFWNLQKLKQELERFLLDMNRVIVSPEEIFQDVEAKDFLFFYVPYYEGEQGFKALVEFWVEHINYEDEVLVECIYRIYEQLEQTGESYFQNQVFADIKCLEEPMIPKAAKREETIPVVEEKTPTVLPEQKRSLFGLFDGRKKKVREEKEDYLTRLQNLPPVGAVAEDYYEEKREDENFGKTLYIEETASQQQNNELCTADGKVLAVVEKEPVTIGKKKEEADVVVPDPSVSRVHARITREDSGVFISDLNSTNGTFKNGLRLLPYEKRLLEAGDEIKVGRVVLMFR